MGLESHLLVVGHSDMNKCELKMSFRIWTYVPFLVVLIIGLNFGIGQSAIVPRNGIVTINVKGNVRNATTKENITMDVLQEAVDDYLDLSDAFYSPAANETVREKRTLQLFRTIANRTRSGVKSLRKLFSGRSGDDSEEAPTRGGFRKFFSDLLNRILISLTKLWDRLTSFFRRGGNSDGGDGESDSESGGGGGGRFSAVVKRVRTGAAALAKRLRGGGGSGGSSGGIGGLFASLSELNPKSTPEPYVIDYDAGMKEEMKVESEVEKAEKEAEKIVEISSTTISSSTVTPETSYAVSGGYGEGSSDEELPTNAVRSVDAMTFDHDNEASSSWSSDSFIPFPMDSDPNYHLNGVPVQTYYSVSPSSWVTTRSRRNPSSEYDSYYK